MEIRVQDISTDNVTIPNIFQLADLQAYFPVYKQLKSHRVGKSVIWTVQKVLAQFFVSYGLLSFVLLHWHKYIVVGECCISSALHACLLLSANQPAALLPHIWAN